MNTDSTKLNIGNIIGFLKTTSFVLLFQDLPKKNEFFTQLLIIAFLKSKKISKLFKIIKKDSISFNYFRSFTKDVGLKPDIPTISFDYENFLNNYHVNEKNINTDVIYKQFCKEHAKKKKFIFCFFSLLLILTVISASISMISLAFLGAIFVGFILFEIFKDKDEHVSLVYHLHHIHNYLVREQNNVHTLYEQISRITMPEKNGEKANIEVQMVLKDQKSQDGFINTFMESCNKIKNDKVNFTTHNSVVIKIIDNLTFESINDCYMNFPVLLEHYQKSTEKLYKKEYADQLSQVYLLFLNELYNHEKYDTCLCIFYSIFSDFNLKKHSELKRILVNSSFDMTTVFDKVHDKKNLVWILSHVEKKLDEVKKSLQTEADIKTIKIKQREQINLNFIKESLLVKISPNTYIEILKQHNINYFLT